MSAVDARRDRAVGCLLGLAIGDAVGTALEFKVRDTYQHLTVTVGGRPFHLKPGEWTDDTSMALCLADSLLARGRLEPDDLATRFLRWRREGHNSVNGRCFDIGITTAEALDRFRRTGEPLSGSSDPATAGNSSIMRLAPVALFHVDDEAKAVDAAVLQSWVTHAAPEPLESCPLLTRVLVQLIDGRGRGALVQDTANYTSSEVRDIAAGDWRAKDRPPFARPAMSLTRWRPPCGRCSKPKASGMWTRSGLSPARLPALCTDSPEPRASGLSG